MEKKEEEYTQQQQQQQQQQEQHQKKKRPLGIVFDIDGTLIRESRHLSGIFVRPHVIEFLVWCRQRGHRIAIWTAGHEWWADKVVRRLCPLVQQRLLVGNNNNNDQVHVCCGKDCTATFDFAWGGDKMRVERPMKLREMNKRIERGEMQCEWCDFYKDDCDKCQCRAGPNECPCRNAKDLRKLWWGASSGEKSQQQQRKEQQPSCTLFTTSRERTLIVENTPQMCRYTYGNALYVPTYRGGSGIDDKIFVALQHYIEQTLEEDTVDVTRVIKCDHPQGPHACYHQNWWP